MLSGGRKSSGMTRRRRHEPTSRLRLLVVFTVLALTAISAVQPISAVATPGPAEAREWWFDTWGVPALWAEGADGRGITVAVIDTGVQASVPELTSRILPGADFIGNGSDGRQDFDSDSFSHGTAMASIIVAQQGYGGIEGLAPAARVLPLAVPLQGVIRSGGAATPNATPAAIRYAADHGARIISMSLGESVYQAEDPAPCSTAMQNAIVYAIAKGSLVVAASGNSGQDGSPVDEPGVCLGVVSVGSVDEQLNVSSFSSRHPYLTLTAPGEEIATLTKVPDEGFVGSGTSQATAMTSAALALVWSKYPTETGQQILSRLLNTALDRGPAGRDPAYGLGFIEPGRAIAAGVVVADKANPVSSGVQPLLRLASSASVTPRAKAPAGNAAADLGAVQVGAAPNALSGQVIATAAAAAFFLVTAVLAFLAAARRRRIVRPEVSAGGPFLDTSGRTIP
ncbi:MAG: peptidase [Frankiales bacterium]|nr:peptidase [Frankiales bacterium]